MRRIYRLLTVGMLSLGLAGCDEDIKYNPLPEAVPLTMSVNEKAFVMGESLKVDIRVDADADGNEVVANEDFDIYFTAKAGTDDMAALFEAFSRVVTFPKGENQIQVEFPVKEQGLEGTRQFQFVAFARGYKMANSSQGIKVSDYYRVNVSMENNSEMAVTEGDRFNLIAKIDKPMSVPVEVTVEADEESAAMFDGLPATLTIRPGRTSARSEAITVKQDFEVTGDKELKLNLSSSSATNPVQASVLTIKMTDLESLADPDLFDMTKVYANPALLFRSYEDDWFAGKESALMSEGTAHPTAELAGWKFDYAVEFHKNATSGDYKKLGNATDANRGSVLSVNWDKYAKITDEGALNLCVGVNGNNYQTAAIHCCKTLGQIWAQNVTRIYPGMRIEVKVRLGGNRTGFVPMIEVKNPLSQGRDGRQAICLMKNASGSAITQLVKGTTAGDTHSSVTAMRKIEEYNIYWMEYVDENNIRLGINGSTTLEVNSGMMESWPFTKAASGSNALGAKGLFLIMRWDLFGEQNELSPELPDGWDTELKSIAPENYATEGPRMEIDWIRFYTNENYVRTEQETVNRDYKETLPAKYYQFY